MKLACVPNPLAKPYDVKDPAIVLKSVFKRAGTENKEKKKKKRNNKKRAKARN